MKLLMGGSPCTHWQDIDGYEGAYKVSSCGEIVNIKTGKLLSGKTERNGYVRVRLSKNGIAKSVLLHRIVAKAFVENPEEHKTVNHKDENKSNNCANNLEWCDMHYQNTYGVGAKNRNRAKERAIVQIDEHGRSIRVWESITEAAKTLSLNPSTVVCVCKGKRRYKSTGGYRFKYAEGMNA